MHALFDTTNQLPEYLVEALPAVGLVRVLLEGADLELLPAVGAHEARGVELPPHGSDAAAHCGWQSPSQWFDDLYNIIFWDAVY